MRQKRRDYHGLLAPDNPIHPGMYALSAKPRYSRNSLEDVLTARRSQNSRAKVPGATYKPKIPAWAPRNRRIFSQIISMIPSGLADYLQNLS
jgi:hypothetical protein